MQTPMVQSRQQPARVTLCSNVHPSGRCQANKGKQEQAVQSGVRYPTSPWVVLRGGVGWGGGKWAGGCRKVDKRNWSEGMEYNFVLDSLLYTNVFFQIPPPHLRQPPTHSTRTRIGLGSGAEAGAQIKLPKASNSSCKMQAVLQTVRVIRYKLGYNHLVGSIT